MRSDAKILIGVDDSGTGALAGNLILCAVAFLQSDPPVAVSWRTRRGDRMAVARDSKVIHNAEERQMLNQAIRSCAQAVTVIEFTPEEIDAKLITNLLPQAIRLVIARCMEQLAYLGKFTNPREFHVLLDGETEFHSDLPFSVEAIPDGDKTVWQIGAASIVAKVACDARMDAIHEKYPSWGFDRHRGYATKEHRELLSTRGPLSVHRKSFRPVYLALGGRKEEF